MKSAKQLELSVSVLGRAAWRMLQGAGSLTVLGVTSKGAFLQDEAGGVCFLSQEGWRGPLTANLREHVSLRDYLRVGARGLLHGGGITFPACRIVIPAEAETWAAAPIEMAGFVPGEALGRGCTLARQMDWTGSLFQAFSAAFMESAWERAVQALLDLAPGQGDWLEKLPELLGLGEGLTPAGDDFICGWLLAQQALDLDLSIPAQGARSLTDLPVLARERTTTLSAALITCAAAGQADERLLQAQAWLLTGAGDAEKIKEELLTYGSSSGADALAGMLASLIWINQTN